VRPPGPSATDEDKSFARLKRALRKAERRGGDGGEIGGTGATILKFLPAPLARLADKGRIGAEEIRAADDIAVAVTAFGGGANLAQVFYATAAHTGVPYGALGFATYETGSTLATAGTWSAVPTRLELLRAGVPLPGAAVQSLYDPITATFTSSNTYAPAATAPTTSAGVQAGSQAITPSSSAHLLRVRGQLLLGSTGAASPNQTLFLTQDSGSSAIAAACFAASAAATVPSQGSVIYQTLAGTLVSTAFKLWGASSTGVVNVNTAGGGSAFFGGNTSSHILVEEIAT
jgi:hypothetical protein